MSNSEERLLILKMLEQGKITSDEAVKLLEALDSSGSAAKSHSEGAPKYQKEPNFYDEIEKARQKLNEWKKDFNKKYNQKDFDRMIEEFSEKAEKLGKTVAATTFGLVDKMVDFVGSFVDTNAFNIFGNYKVEERTFESDVPEDTNLLIEGSNGSIFVKKHLDDKIIIKSKVRSPQNNADEILTFEKSTGTISLKLSNKSNISVSHEVFLPPAKFNSVKFDNSNGKIYVEDCNASSFDCITKNGAIDLMGINSDMINVSTRNARVQISYVIGKAIEINTNNSLIEIKNVKTETVKASTTNGRLFIENVQTYENCSEINLLLKTSNAGIKVNMNDMDNKAYKVKAQTAYGAINLLIPELIYHNINKQSNEKSFVEAESNGYVNYPTKVNIYAETVHGDIEVVK
jgi:DUF4097 and DUF4098 domain-containing protein YvlB